MDQAAPAHQGVLRDELERGKDANLDRHLGLRPGGNRQKEAEPRREPLHNSTDFERHPVRKNPHFTGSFAD